MFNSSLGWGGGGGGGGGGGVGMVNSRIQFFFSKMQLLYLLTCLFAYVFLSFFCLFYVLYE